MTNRNSGSSYQDTLQSLASFRPIFDNPSGYLLQASGNTNSTTQNRSSETPGQQEMARAATAEHFEQHVLCTDEDSSKTVLGAMTHG